MTLYTNRHARRKDEKVYCASRELECLKLRSQYDAIVKPDHLPHVNTDIIFSDWLGSLSRMCPPNYRREEIMATLRDNGFHVGLSSDHTIIATDETEATLIRLTFPDARVEVRA